MKGLKGKVGIVAGGGRGIGAATARRLAEEGAHVVIGDLMGDWAREVAESIRSTGGTATGIELDGTKADSQAAIVACAVETYGGLDFYHSNLAGGTGGDNDILDCPEDVLDLSFAINTKSHFLATQAALPKMLERGGGAMIYTSSGAASGGAPWQVAYPMTKNAIHALARHVAAKFGKKGVRANVICPGLVDTPMHDPFRKEPNAPPTVALDNYPLRRWASADEIADAVLFLTCGESAYVTGVTLAVDGGRTMH